MNRIKRADIVNIKEISTVLSKMEADEITKFFQELLTPAEIETLSKRWSIVKMLANENCTQREIAKNLRVSLCKVTRGAKILKEKGAITPKVIKGEINDN